MTLLNAVSREMHEGNVLLNLRKRFERELIYTYIGSILVSVNPYKMFNIYGTDMVALYKGRALGENPPHLFAIANAAYSTMMDAKQNQILEAAPLLESFGNAKTVRNDNSSRFGKYIEVFLEDGVISGAITSQYLLEKSRIVFQAKDERNYHIFYEMLAGLPSQQKQAFYLQEAETYYYLNQGGDCGINAAMEILHFAPEDQLSIFRVLSSVLHLGNVYFQKHEVTSPVHLKYRLVLMEHTGSDLQQLRAALHQLCKRVHAVLLQQGGFQGGAGESDNRGYDMVCHVITPQEEYSREQIPWQDIPFNDNQPCIDLIATKPHGILRILDDQSCFPQATDHTFLQKCHYHHGNNPLYQKPKMPLPEFTIKHFAGRVTYQVHKFLDKNYDQVRQDILDLFIQSKNKVREEKHMIAEHHTSDVKCVLTEIIKKNKTINVNVIYSSCHSDGVKPVLGSRRGHGAAERGSPEEKQHSDQEVPGTDCQQQVPTVPAGTVGEDGKVKNLL
uniref:Myosin motor domain-containing protein n=1 Tax=Cynoglossus semilaevis TaxID=244447 RepID=A0A3P8WPV5_CYNSE